MVSVSPSPPATPKSVDELIQSIVEIVREQVEQTGRPLDGSFLAHLVRRRYPDIDYASVGLTRLGDAVRIAEKQGVLIRHTDVKHLVLSPAATTDKPAPIAPPEAETPERVYVRSDLWQAFVFAKRPSYVNRTTFALVGPNESSAQHVAVAIEPITEKLQFEWAGEFLRSRTDIANHNEDDCLDLVHGRPNRLGWSLNRDWKVFRAAHVVAHIKAWAKTNSLPIEEILLPAKSPPRPTRPQQALDDSSDLRKAIIAVIEEMPLSELERIALPLHYVLRHFVPK